ncbi:MAG: hypothetical protein WC966_02285 [Bradymonadales bacterium]|jgi:leucyl aminopeptidase (aminopeptidase T)
MSLREQYSRRYQKIAQSLEKIFGACEKPRRFALLVDVPKTAKEDSSAWLDRRELATQWLREAQLAVLLGFSHDSFELLAYESVGAANADLLNPAKSIRIANDAIPSDAAQLNAYDAENTEFEQIYEHYDCLVALTQYSATAPLKMAAKRFGFRAATMPGFTRAMIPALCVDLDEIERKVVLYADLLTKADGATIQFAVRGEHSSSLYLDLRHRSGVASTGILDKAGMAGNLPSGEAYIVPYEGEIHATPSQSEGVLPIEVNGNVVFCEVKENRVVRLRSEEQSSYIDAAHYFKDPALANVAELGLGVLGELGVQPVGSVLLDEKLAPHIAFGRSEHLGGVTSPASFKDAKNVSHEDFVYHHKMMPQISIISIILNIDNKERKVFENGAYC